MVVLTTCLTTSSCMNWLFHKAFLWKDYDSVRRDSVLHVNMTSPALHEKALWSSVTAYILYPFEASILNYILMPSMLF
jgi:AmiR/NasT family two-component response regulator